LVVLHKQPSTHIRVVVSNVQATAVHAALMLKQTKQLVSHA